MVRLNGEQRAYRPGMSLKDLVDDYNAGRPGRAGRLAFDEFVVIVNGKALTAAQAREKTLSDNDTVIIVPMIDGG